MDEDERVKNINMDAAAILRGWIEGIDDGLFTTDDLLAEVYGGLIAAIALGYDPTVLVDDATKAANKLIEMAEEELTNTEE